MVLEVEILQNLDKILLRQEEEKVEKVLPLVLE